VSPEHGIPKNGFIEVKLPSGIEFTQGAGFSVTRDAVNDA
jgi:hypothetical protein